MKPTIQIDQTSRRDLYDREIGKGSLFPKTDYGFQAASAGTSSGHCFSVRRPSFRAISENYFQNESRRNFAGEAMLFLVIVMTAVLPIINSASVLAQMVRSFAVIQ